MFNNYRKLNFLPKCFQIIPSSHSFVEWHFFQPVRKTETPSRFGDYFPPQKLAGNKFVSPTFCVQLLICYYVTKWNSHEQLILSCNVTSYWRNLCDSIPLFLAFNTSIMHCNHVLTILIITFAVYQFLSSAHAVGFFVIFSIQHWSLSSSNNC